MATPSRAKPLATYTDLPAGHMASHPSPSAMCTPCPHTSSHSSPSDNSNEMASASPSEKTPPFASQTVPSCPCSTGATMSTRYPWCPRHPQPHLSTPPLPPLPRPLATAHGSQPHT
eukprot:6207611-Prymnesium_polylepis.2